MSNRVAWGILGCSNVAIGKVVPAIKDLPNVHIQAIASRDSKKATNAAKQFSIEKAYGSYKELLKDSSVDAVYISLPNSHHCQWTIEAASEGKHVLCEKPAAITPDEASQMIAACRDNNVLFLEGYMYRFHPQHKWIRDSIASGLIGEPKLMRVSFSFPMESRHSSIRLNKSLGGGCLYDVGSYCVNATRWLFKGEPMSATCHVLKPSDKFVETTLISILKFDNCRSAVIDCSFEMSRRHSYEVVGTKGRIEVPEAFIPTGETRVRLYDNSGRYHIEKFSPSNQYALEFSHFSDCIFGELELTIDPEDSIKNAQAVAMIRQSFT